MWVRQTLLGIIGLSSGVVIAGGLFALIVELGVIADFADRTHTADKILLYEDCAALGGVAGNLISVFRPQMGYLGFLLPVFGLLAGIFVGCWAMAYVNVRQILSAVSLSGVQHKHFKKSRYPVGYLLFEYHRMQKGCQ